MRLLSFVLLSAAACGGSQSKTETNRTLDQRLADNKAEERARYYYKNDGHTWIFNCADTVLDDQLTTGGLKVTHWQPCWQTGTVRDKEIVRQERRDQQLESPDHEQTLALAHANEVACAGISPQERNTSPFVHRKQIAEVIPHRIAARPAGVRIVFKPAFGLTADWLRKDIACHQARWEALGRDPALMVGDPTLVDGATVTVLERAGHVEVLVETNTPEQAEIAIARAQGKLTSPSAVAQP